jgi:NhaP-type Na+/H+ or K+/H+ antiporter
MFPPVGKLAFFVFALAVIGTGQLVHAATDSLVISSVVGFLAGGVLGVLATIPVLLAWARKEKAQLSNHYAHAIARILAGRHAQPAEARVDCAIEWVGGADVRHTAGQATRAS